MKKILTIILYCICAITLQAQSQQDLQKGYEKFGRLLYYINSHYVDTAQIHKLVEKAVVNTLRNLDPHSVYLNADDVKAANEPLEGNFEGIGVEFNILLDTLTVVTPIAGGPSEMVGIKAGDRIVAVDGKNIAGIGLRNNDVFKLLRGPKGTIVDMEIMRKGVEELLQFRVIRDKIPIFSLDAFYEVEPGLIYLRLSRFSMTTIQEIKEALAKFKKKPAKMILDLRDNAGGVLQASIDLANQFFDKGCLLVYNEGVHWPKTMEISTDEGFFKEGELVVLVDEGSASASEIVAGAIQDWDRGILVGRRTFGKGLVQQLLPLTDGSQIRLTVARYHTPTGRAIQRPYDAGHIEKYYDDLYKRYSNGEIYSKDSIHFPDSLKYYTLKDKRLVYGGGGIMPDVFMPLDTTYYSVYYSRLVRMGLLYQFVLRYMDENRAALQAKYQKFANFDRKYEVDEALFEELLNYAESHKLPRNNDDITISAPQIKLVLKAYIARALWGMSAYFETVNKHDREFQKAVELLRAPKRN
ncbi:MAG: S41 family peptidase [Prevotellaceae bacterium]|jgi:carboxyl-terminal processing protease|nr:S41 family peptidase [Prevotellaceae bacterium]